MIEINLLPEQYRAVERTPLPVFVGIIAGIGLICGAVFFMLQGVQRTNTLKNEMKTVDLQLEEAQRKAKEFDELERRIREARGRITTVLKIAESKIPWALKLEQLVRIMPHYAWISNLQAERTGNGGSLKMAVNLRGSSLERYTDFKSILRSDPNFFYHFEQIPSSKVRSQRTTAEFVEPKYLTFELTLPLAQAEVGVAPKGRRR